MRALRAGKESYAVIAETLRAFATGKHEERVPIYAMLATPLEVLRQRATSLGGGSVVESRCALGGGTTPSETISSIAVEVPGHAQTLHARFLANDPPIVGRIVDGRFTLEVRALSSEDIAAVRTALQ
jgi:seryl-tRNA(Sec) selenium transferase